MLSRPHKQPAFQHVYVTTLLLSTCCLLQFSPLTSAEETKKDDVINVVYFAPEDSRWMFSRKRAGPAIDFAINKVSKTLLPGRRIRTHFADSKCDSKSAPLAAFEWSTKNASVFLGPVCDYSIAPVARYAPHWNIPVVTPGAMAHNFGTGNEFPRLTRVGATFNDIALQMHILLVKYNWSKLAILYDSDALNHITENYCYLMISALGWYFKAVVQPPLDLRQEQIRPEDGPRGYEKLLKEDVGILKSS